jgi:mannose-6-phosphate isomerase-like protein (cupin superfamily)
VDEWPDELDALRASAEHHRLLFENDRVRVVESVIPSGETTAVHTHRRPNVQYIVHGSRIVRRDADGVVTSEGTQLEDASTLWSDPIPPHTVENVGAEELRVIVVELKS